MPIETAVWRPARSWGAGRRFRLIGLDTRLSRRLKRLTNSCGCVAAPHKDGLGAWGRPNQTGSIRFREVLRGISPLIRRRLLVRSDSTLADLHEVLQVAFGWYDLRLNRFEIRGRNYSVDRHRGGLTGADDREVRLRNLHLRRLQRFDYEYDFGDSWIHDIRLKRAIVVDSKKTYPTYVAGRYATPPRGLRRPGRRIHG